jgi:hypothetical protein
MMIAENVFNKQLQAGYMGGQSALELGGTLTIIH